MREWSYAASGLYVLGCKSLHFQDFPQDIPPLGSELIHCVCFFSCMHYCLSARLNICSFNFEELLWDRQEFSNIFGF